VVVVPGQPAASDVAGADGPASGVGGAVAVTTPPDDNDDPPLVQAKDEYLSAAEVEDLTNETYPLDPEAADEMPDDDGEADVDDGEAAQTGTDARG
jgi:hypothetical protein